MPRNKEAPDDPGLLKEFCLAAELLQNDQPLPHIKMAVLGTTQHHRTLGGKQKNHYSSSSKRNFGRAGMAAGKLPEEKRRRAQDTAIRHWDEGEHPLEVWGRYAEGEGFSPQATHMGSRMIREKFLDKKTGWVFGMTWARQTLGSKGKMVSRDTAYKYLGELIDAGVLVKRQRLGPDGPINFYELFRIREMSFYGGMSTFSTIREGVNTLPHDPTARASGAGAEGGEKTEKNSGGAVPLAEARADAVAAEAAQPPTAPTGTKAHLSQVARKKRLSALLARGYRKNSATPRRSADSPPEKSHTRPPRKPLHGPGWDWRNAKANMRNAEDWAHHNPEGRELADLLIAATNQSELPRNQAVPKRLARVLMRRFQEGQIDKSGALALAYYSPGGNIFDLLGGRLRETLADARTFMAASATRNGLRWISATEGATVSVQSRFSAETHLEAALAEDLGIPGRTSGAHLDLLKALGATDDPEAVARDYFGRREEDDRRLEAACAINVTVEEALRSMAPEAAGDNLDRFTLETRRFGLLQHLARDAAKRGTAPDGDVAYATRNLR